MYRRLLLSMPLSHVYDALSHVYDALSHVYHTNSYNVCRTLCSKLCHALGRAAEQRGFSTEAASNMSKRDISKSGGALAPNTHMDGL